MLTSTDKPFAVAADQNKESILEALVDIVSDGDEVLELGSGTGQHACYFSNQLPGITWQPTELMPLIPTIRQWLESDGSDNIKPPLVLDMNEVDWPVESADVVYTANTLHIVSEHVVESMFTGVGRVLRDGGRFCAYGPFSFAGTHTSASNEQFDRDLKQNDPRSGVRDMTWLNELAVDNGLREAELIEMPSNNFIAVWRRLLLN